MTLPKTWPFAGSEYVLAPDSFAYIKAWAETGHAAALEVLRAHDTAHRAMTDLCVLHEHYCEAAGFRT